MSVDTFNLSRINYNVLNYVGCVTPRKGVNYCIIEVIK